MAAFTVQLPNECACRTVTWGQEGILVEGMVDDWCSEYGLASGDCVDSYETLTVFQGHRTLWLAKKETGVSLCTLNYVHILGGSRWIGWQLRSSKENDKALFSHCVFSGCCIDNGILRCGGGSPTSDFLSLLWGNERGL
jgi:hypothetical protein